MSNDILLVDDNPGSIQVLGRMLAPLGRVRFATNGLGALDQIRQDPPDLVMLDAEMPGMDGFQVCQSLKDDPVTAAVPVVFYSSHDEPEFELKGLQLGATDYIAKNTSPPLVMARIKAQIQAKRAADAYRKLATLDPLTEVLNRRSFHSALQREWKRGLRTGQPISLLLVDLDHFELFNTRYSHKLAGDVWLKAIAQSLDHLVMRPADLVARYEGDAFAILLPQTPRAGAEHLAHRVLDAIEALGVPHEASPTANHLTVSVGVSSYDEDSECWIAATDETRWGVHPRCNALDLARSAERSLAMAKAAGRAQAWSLDICNLNKPAQAREILPMHRAPIKAHRV